MVRTRVFYVFYFLSCPVWQAMPRPFAFEQLSLLASNDEERDKLLELSSAEGVDLYHDYVYREKRGWWEVLTDFASLRVPLGRLIALLPRLQPRAFSIASPPPLWPRPGAPPSASVATPAPPPQLELCVAVVEYKTRYGRTKRGVCSSWLAARSPFTSSPVVAAAPASALVPIWLRPGTFPKAAVFSPAVPVVCIGPGTGVAPMRSIIFARFHARAAAAAAAQNLSVVPPQPPDMLFFGCRHVAKDFLFGADFQALAAPQQVGMSPLALHCAFSRDEAAPGGGRLYVTHRLAAAGAGVWAALAAGGAVLVAGSAGQMPKDVHAALVKVVQEHGGFDAKGAADFLRHLERAGRYSVEAYG
jgi:sulfite reductase alpha subunit-like flavoprotein